MRSEIIRTIYDAAREARVSPFLMSGSALGLARHGGPIPGDRDIDVGLFADAYGPDDRNRFLSALFDAGATYTQGWLRYGQIGGQDTIDIDGVPVDIHCCPIIDGRRIHYAYMQVDNENLDDLWQLCEYQFSPFSISPVEFSGVAVFAPSALDLYLREHFGPGYMTPCESWHWATSAPNCRLMNIFRHRIRPGIDHDLCALR